MTNFVRTILSEAAQGNFSFFIFAVGAASLAVNILRGRK